MRLPLILASLLVFSACNSGILGDTSIPDTGTSGATTDTGATGDTGTTDTGHHHDTGGHDSGGYDTGGGGGGGGGDTGTNGCTATVLETSPADNETNVAVNKVMTAKFSAVVGPNDWSLTVDGVTGHSALASNGLTATFVADAPLDTQTDYTMHASVCGQDHVVHFTTATGPLPPEDLTGNTYAINYQDITWVQPPNIGQLVSSYVNIQYILLNIIGVDTGNETIHAAASLGITDPNSGDIVQDPCNTAYDFGTQDFSGNPVFDVGPADFSSGNFTVSNAEIKAAFVDGGASIQDIRISGQIDTAAFQYDVCSWGNLVHCVQCIDNPDANTCVDVELVADHADKVDGLVFDPAIDPTQNPSCN